MTWTAPVAAVWAAVDTENTANIAESVLHLSESIAPPPLAPLYSATILSFAHLHTLAWKIQTLQVTQGHAGPQGDGGGGGGNHNAAWCFVSHHLFSRPPAWQIRRWREASTQKRKQTIQQMAANHFIRHSRKRKHNLPSRLFQCKLKDRVKDRQVYLKWGYSHNSGV